MKRLVLTLGAAVLGALLAQCSPTPCDVSNCPDGCCDTKGKCRPGTDHYYCGGGGEACVTCLQGVRCTDARVCVRDVVVTGARDGGPRPVPDAGQDAGVVACRAVSVWPSQFTQGGYSASIDFNYSSAYSSNPAAPPDAGYDELYLEVYYFGGLTVPYSTTFQSTDTWAACETCLAVFSGCDATGACQSGYFAQSGDITVSAATRDRDAGSMSTSVSSVRLVEWDFGADAPVDGGSCITIGSAAWTSSWDAGAADGG